MIRLVSKRTALAALTLGIALVGSAGSARAGVAIYLAEDGGAYSLVGTSAGNLAGFTGSFGDFTLQADTALTNFAGTNLLGQLQTTTNSTLGSGAVGTHTLHVLAAVVSGTASGDPLASFTLPSGPALILQSQLAISGAAPLFPSGSSVSFTSFADASGNPLAPAGGTPSPTVSLSSFTPNSITAADTLFTGTQSVYTLYNVTNITLVGANSSVGSTGTTNVANAVPEPSSIVALVAGLPFLGLALRRRKASK